MKDRFFRPSIVWFGVWLAIFIAILLIGSWQTRLYWQDEFADAANLEILTLRALLPAAASSWKDKKRPDLLKNIIDADLGPYALVLTDRAGGIQYVSPGLPAGKIDPGWLQGKEFFYLLADQSSGAAVAGPFTNGNGKAAGDRAAALGRLYLVPKAPAGSRWTSAGTFRNVLPPARTVTAFTLLSYALVLVGFASICAITARFQRHFEEVREKQHEVELEARELRIQVLESKIKSADLRLQLLDRSLEKAQARLHEAQKTIAELTSAIQYESTRNEELQENLRQAEAEKDEAVASIQEIESDRERIVKELKELEALREVEEMNYPEASRERARRPKEFLWLSQVYRNLQFSRRALENITELQNSPDIFPALPDALAALNGSSLESLLDGGAFPSRSAVRYTQPLAHYHGEFWEYRFSKDGRIFFGPSRSKTLNIDTILLKRKFSENRHKYEKYLEQTLGKDNDDLRPLA